MNAKNEPVIQYQEQIRFECQSCSGRFWIDKSEFKEGIRHCPLCGITEFKLVEDNKENGGAIPLDGGGLSESHGEKERAVWERLYEKKGSDFPILLNHEKIFLIMGGTIFLTLFIIAQYKMAAGHALILDTVFATIATLVGIFLSETIIEQVKVYFGETLREKVNVNHLMKSLKLNTYPEPKIEFFLAMMYAVTCFFVALRLWTLDADISHLPETTRGMLLKIGLATHMDVESEFPMMLMFALISGFVLLGALLSLYFLIEPRLSLKLRNRLSYPFTYGFGMFRVFHEIFRSIVKIILFIMITWREFMSGCFYLLVKILIGLERKHNFLNIAEIEYLIYVRAFLIVVGPIGYILVFAIRY